MTLFENYYQNKIFYSDEFQGPYKNDPYISGAQIIGGQLLINPIGVALCKALTARTPLRYDVATEMAFNNFIASNPEHCKLANLHQVPTINVSM